MWGYEVVIDEGSVVGITGICDKGTGNFRIGREPREHQTQAANLSMR